MAEERTPADLSHLVSGEDDVSLTPDELLRRTGLQPCNITVKGFWKDAVYRINWDAADALDYDTGLSGSIGQMIEDGVLEPVESEQFEVDDIAGVNIVTDA